VSTHQPGTNSDPFAEDDPVGDGGGDDEFDALGFDTSFGAEPGGLSDQDDTPPGGIYVGEDVQVLDASAIGRALAEVEGRTEDEGFPELGPLQQGLVGIDLGASAAVMATFDASGRHQIVQNEHDERLTPGQIFFDDDGEQLVGREARQMAPSAPDRAILDLKSVVADPEFHFSPGGGAELGGDEVLAIFLKHLVQDARDEGHSVTHVALAAPAWYDEAQRQVIEKAVARLDDVDLVGVTEECLAAAVPFSLRLPDLNPRQALVFDLGHAALGVGVVRCASGDIEVLAQAAERELGSGAWDELLAREAARKFKEAHGLDIYADESALIDLRLKAEDAKRALSARAQCTLVAQAGGKSLKVGFTRRGFEEAAKGLVQSSLALARQVRDQAGLNGWDEVDALIMTGGGCKTPIVRRSLKGEVGRDPERGTGMEEGVALGALYWGIGERHRRA
jgi:molecular chaperone DnaK